MPIEMPSSIQYGADSARSRSAAAPTTSAARASGTPTRAPHAAGARPTAGRFMGDARSRREWQHRPPDRHMTGAGADRPQTHPGLRSLYSPRSMTYVIVGTCIKDDSCVEVCPVDCIHPKPGAPDFETAEQLYIDPLECIDCDACVEACPVDAIYAEAWVPEKHEYAIDLNAEFFAQRVPGRAAVLWRTDRCAWPSWAPAPLARS